LFSLSFKHVYSQLADKIILSTGIKQNSWHPVINFYKVNEEAIMQDEIENTAGTTTKAFLLGIGGVMLVLGILVLMPMFFTYLSEGDIRAPSELHPTDSARKSGQANYQ